MFRHAGECGAKIFDGVKVNSIEFTPTNGEISSDSWLPNIGRPVSASWSTKPGASGSIKFDYLVDASGRNGVLSTKYLRNRTYSKALKNIANWAYFTGAGVYGEGTDRAGVPFFEALRGKTSNPPIQFVENNKE